jgi:hypothetical protein
MVRTARQSAKILLRRNLDREVTTLPPRSLRSVLGIFAHLESLPPNVATITDHTPQKGACAAKPGPISPMEPPEKVSFRELGRQVIGAARRQVEGLQVRLEQASSLVLINDWPVADRLWSEFLTACRIPLFELNFLEELWEINPDKLEIGGGSLTRHWHQFVLIQAETELLLARRRSLVELSDTLEKGLGRWLTRFAEILEALDETSMA